jgi:hypothetical protein
MAGDYRGEKLVNRTVDFSWPEREFMKRRRKKARSVV